MLLFKKKFLELIRNGKKTQTIRLWNRPRMRTGQRSYIPGIGYISIVSVDPVEIDLLTDEDALPDGFESADSLKKELRILYVEEIEKGFRAYRIRFSVYPPEEQSRMREEKKRLKDISARSACKKSDHQKAKEVEESLDKLKQLAMNPSPNKKNKNG